MKKYFSHYILSGCTVGLSLTAPALHAQLNTAVTPYANRALFQTGATNAGAPATNVVDFQDIPQYTPATGSGFIPTFTKAGFVTFNVGSFRHEIVDGTNLGSPNNNVYFTLAPDKTLGVADLTFATGIFSLGFDFKDGAGNGTASMVPQAFTFSLFSGMTSLGSQTLTTVPVGTSFAFAGFTSTLPITRLFVTSSNNTPNQDFVLDNLAASNPVPEPGVTASIVLGLVGLVAGRRFIRQRRQA